eukprot:3521902-Alexandrium_andersonii.AAC.1
MSASLVGSEMCIRDRLKAASSSPAHDFWWPDFGVQFTELTEVLLRYAAPSQLFSLETGKPEPERVPQEAAEGGGHVANSLQDPQA